METEPPRFRLSDVGRVVEISRLNDDRRSVAISVASEAEDFSPVR